MGRTVDPTKYTVPYREKFKTDVAFEAARRARIARMLEDGVYLRWPCGRCFGTPRRLTSQQITEMMEAL